MELSFYPEKDWLPGDEIVIAGTSFNGDQAETVTVMEVGANTCTGSQCSTEIQINKPLKFFHDASA